MVIGGSWANEIRNCLEGHPEKDLPVSALGPRTRTAESTAPERMVSRRANADPLGKFAVNSSGPETAGNLAPVGRSFGGGDT
jgi:hypothetical protein